MNRAEGPEEGDTRRLSTRGRVRRSTRYNASNVDRRRSSSGNSYKSVHFTNGDHAASSGAKFFNKAAASPGRGVADTLDPAHTQPQRSVPHSMGVVLSGRSSEARSRIIASAVGRNMSLEGVATGEPTQPALLPGAFKGKVIPEQVRGRGVTDRRQQQNLPHSMRAQDAGRGGRSKPSPTANLDQIQGSEHGHQRHQTLYHERAMAVMDVDTRRERQSKSDVNSWNIGAHDARASRSRRASTSSVEQRSASLNMISRSRSSRDRNDEGSADDRILVLWLNSILLRAGVDKDVEQHLRQVYALSDLRDLKLLSAVVGKIAGVDIVFEEELPPDAHGELGKASPASAGDGTPTSAERRTPGIQDRRKQRYNKADGGGRASDPARARKLRGSSSSGETFTGSKSESNSSMDDFGDSLLGVVGSGSAVVDAALQDLEHVTVQGESSKRRGRSIRSFLGSFPNGRKRAPSKSGTARKIKQDVALLMTGQSEKDRGPPKLPGSIDAAVDRACAGDITAIRKLLSMLQEHRTLLAPAMAANGQGLRRRASSCDPVPRTPFRLAGSRGLGAAGGAARVPRTEPRRKPVMAPYAAAVVAAAAAGALDERASGMSETDSVSTKYRFSPMELMDRAAIPRSYSADSITRPAKPLGETPKKKSSPPPPAVKVVSMRRRYRGSPKGGVDTFDDEEDMRPVGRGARKGREAAAVAAGADAAARAAALPSSRSSSRPRGSQDKREGSGGGDAQAPLDGRVRQDKFVASAMAARRRASAPSEQSSSEFFFDREAPEGQRSDSLDGAPTQETSLEGGFAQHTSARSPAWRWSPATSADAPSARPSAAPASSGAHVGRKPHRSTSSPVSSALSSTALATESSAQSLDATGSSASRASPPKSVGSGEVGGWKQALSWRSRLPAPPTVTTAATVTTPSAPAMTRRASDPPPLSAGRATSMTIAMLESAPGPLPSRRASLPLPLLPLEAAARADESGILSAGRAPIKSPSKANPSLDGSAGCTAAAVPSPLSAAAPVGSVRKPGGACVYDPAPKTTAVILEHASGPSQQGDAAGTAGEGGEAMAGALSSLNVPAAGVAKTAPLSTASSAAASAFEVPPAPAEVAAAPTGLLSRNGGGKVALDEGSLAEATQGSGSAARVGLASPEAAHETIVAGASADDVDATAAAKKLSSGARMSALSLSMRRHKKRQDVPSAESGGGGGASSSNAEGGSSLVSHGSFRSSDGRRARRAPSLTATPIHRQDRGNETSDIVAAFTAAVEAAGVRTPSKFREGSAVSGTSSGAAADDADLTRSGSRAPVSTVTSNTRLPAVDESIAVAAPERVAPQPPAPTTSSGSVPIVAPGDMTATVVPDQGASFVLASSGAISELQALQSGAGNNRELGAIEMDWRWWDTAAAESVQDVLGADADVEEETRAAAAGGTARGMHAAGGSTNALEAGASSRPKNKNSWESEEGSRELAALMAQRAEELEEERRALEADLAAATELQKALSEDVDRCLPAVARQREAWPEMPDREAEGANVGAENTRAILVVSRSPAFEDAVDPAEDRRELMRRFGLYASNDSASDTPTRPPLAISGHAAEGASPAVKAIDGSYAPSPRLIQGGPGAEFDASTEAQQPVSTASSGQADVAGTGTSAARAFASDCPEGARLVVEYVGSVEGIARASLVSVNWRAAVRAAEDRLYKVVVRRAGVTPRFRAAMWEHMVLHRPPRPRQAGLPNDPVCPVPTDQEARRLSLDELARQGKRSEWSKAIDADVARTFGRPTSQRIPSGIGIRPDSRRRHWWPESLGGAPLGARTPGPAASPERHQADYEKESEKGKADTTSFLRPASAGGEDGFTEALVQNHAKPGKDGLVTASTNEPAKKDSNERGVNASGARHGSAAGAKNFGTSSTALTSSLGLRSSSSLSGAVYSTLSPLGSGVSSTASSPSSAASAASDLSERGGTAAAVRDRDRDSGRSTSGSTPSPRTLKQLEVVKAQLTDALRALAVSFDQVGYCQGLDYVVAHLIKCLGTDAHRCTALDPERVFAVLIGLFQGYGLQHIYSVNLEALQLMLGVLDMLIESSLPRLHQHFREQDMDVNFFAVGWFQTLFLYTTRMPHDTLLWLWDVWVTERSYKIFFRAALAILKLSEPKLLKLDLEAIMAYLSRFPRGAARILEKRSLAPIALSFKVTDSILREKQRKLDLSNKRGAAGLGWTRMRTPEPSVAVTVNAAPQNPGEVAGTGGRDARGSGHAKIPIGAAHPGSSTDNPSDPTRPGQASSSSVRHAQSPLIFGDHRRDALGEIESRGLTAVEAFDARGGGSIGEASPMRALVLNDSQADTGTEAARGAGGISLGETETGGASSNVPLVWLNRRRSSAGPVNDAEPQGLVRPGNIGARVPVHVDTLPVTRQRLERPFTEGGGDGCGRQSPLPPGAAGLHGPLPTLEGAGGHRVTADASDGEADTSLPPEMEPLARSVQVIAFPHHGGGRSRGAGGVGGRDRRSRQDRAGRTLDGKNEYTSASNRVPVLPLPRVNTIAAAANKGRKLGGRDEYAFVAAGDE